MYCLLSLYDDVEKSVRRKNDDFNGKKSGELEKVEEGKFAIFSGSFLPLSFFLCSLPEAASASYSSNWWECDSNSSPRKNNTYTRRTQRNPAKRKKWHENVISFYPLDRPSERTTYSRSNETRYFLYKQQTCGMWNAQIKMMTTATFSSGNSCVALTTIHNHYT